MVAGGGGSAGEAEPQAAEIYIERASIKPIRIALTAQLDPLCEDGAMQPWNPTNQLLGPLKPLTSLTNAQIKLSSFDLNKKLEGVHTTQPSPAALTRSPHPQPSTTALSLSP